MKYIHNKKKLKKDKYVFQNKTTENISIKQKKEKKNPILENGMAEE